MDMLLEENYSQNCIYSSPFCRNLWEVLVTQVLCLNPQRCYVDGQSSSHLPLMFPMFRWAREREQAQWKGVERVGRHTSQDKLPDSCAKPREESIERLQDKQRGFPVSSNVAPFAAHGLAVLHGISRDDKRRT